MNKYILFLWLIISCNLVKSQEKLINRQQESTIFDSKIYKRIYQIQLSESPLSIELIETVNCSYMGFLNINLIRRIENEKEMFVGKQEIDATIVRHLMHKLNKMGIETIKDCKINNDCVIGLDGDDTTFNINTNKLNREYSFWELIANQNQEKNLPKNRKQALKILNLLDKNLNLKLSYKDLSKKLPKGRYSYFLGNAIAVFTVE